MPRVNKHATTAIAQWAEDQAGALANVEQAEPDWLNEAQYIASKVDQPIGRPSMLQDVYRLQKVLQAVAAGNYIESACAASGISRNTLYSWKQQAKDGHIACIAFSDALERAEALGELDASQDVRKAGKSPQFWAAAMTHLERRHPTRWGKRQEEGTQAKVVVNIGVKDGDVSITTAE